MKERPQKMFGERILAFIKLNMINSYQYLYVCSKKFSFYYREI